MKRIVLVQAATLTYAVYEGRRQLAVFTSNRLLTPDEVESLRVSPVPSNKGPAA